MLPADGLDGPLLGREEGGGAGEGGGPEGA